MKPTLKTLSLLSLVFALLAVPAQSEEIFEGSIHYTLISGRKPLNMVHTIKGSRMRIELPIQGDTTAVSIVDLQAREITVLMPDQQMYMVMPMPGTSGTTEVDVDFEITGETESILGYACTKYRMKDGRRIVEVWATRGLGRYVASSNLAQGKGRRSLWESRLAAEGLFPLRVIETDGKGKEVFTLEVTKIEKGPVDDAVFTRPEGFRRFEVPSMGGMPFGR